MYAQLAQKHGCNTNTEQALPCFHVTSLPYQNASETEIMQVTGCEAMSILLV